MKVNVTPHADMTGLQQICCVDTAIYSTINVDGAFQSCVAESHYKSSCADSPIHSMHSVEKQWTLDFATCTRYEIYNLKHSPLVCLTQIQCEAETDFRDFSLWKPPK